MDGKELQNAKGIRKEHRHKIPIIGGGIGKFLELEYKVRAKVEDEGLKFNILLNGENLGRTCEIGTEWNVELVEYEAQH